MQAGFVAEVLKELKRNGIHTAIETALGSGIRNIVTQDEETAKKMIAFLKQTKSGRATFLPLNGIKNAQPFKPEQALAETGVIGVADSLVQTQPAYVDVARSLLGRILVVDHMNHAVAIARKYGYSIRMVTLEGELLVPGGAISGGAFKNSANLLSRRREIEELEKKAAAYAETVQTVQREIEAVKEERNGLRAGLETIRRSLQETFIEQNTVRLNVIAAQERCSETQEGYGSLQEEQEAVERRIREIQAEKEQTGEELAVSEKLERSVQEQIAGFQTELDSRRLQESEQTARVSEWDVQAEKFRQQQAFKQQNVERIVGEIARLSEERAELEQELVRNAGEIAQKQKDIAQTEETITASRSAGDEAQETIRADLERKEELTERQKNFFAVREELAERKSGLDKEVYRLNAQKEKLEASMESQINYMWDEYEITLSAAAALRREAFNDLAEMKRGIASLKDEIRKLGDVNVNAIEDYKNLMERYGFLKTQHDDLVEAEQTLLGIIDELDNAMRRQFQEKFGQIGREFDNVFQELFGGGKGTLELQEDEDILEAGIRIIAQPPGKKLQNMMQLSGGEKALTAIALLFAIQNLKPSPFCLLDEIEAALDENNVGRFVKYLHKLTKNTQFIVITHRRGTMEQADRLYGITMQEKGISTLVSVNLIDSELDA